MLPNQEQPVLSRDQLTRYFERLQVPRDTRVYDVAGLQPEETLRYLALLQKLHLVEIPFENLSLHYSPHRQISIHPDELFRKIIADDNGRGGYCMENNTLFGALLRSLGYVLFSAGARVYVGSGWSGWSAATFRSLEYVLRFTQEPHGEHCADWNGQVVRPQQL